MEKIPTESLNKILVWRRLFRSKALLVIHNIELNIYSLDGLKPHVTDD